MMINMNGRTEDEKEAVWQRDGMKADERMLVLFKFGLEEHLTLFREQGQMHMRTMRYFAEEEEENSARGDRFEGASVMFQPAALKMTISHPILGTHVVDSNDLVGPVILSQNRDAEQNVFCMFSLTAPAKEPLLHADHFHFGSHFVIVLNTHEFLRRAYQASINLGLQGQAGSVEYYDESTHSGKIGAFRKPQRFAYQKEYRIVLRPGIVPFRDLMIGDISDITSPVSPLSELDKIVDFSEQTAIADGWVKTDSPNVRK
jgi:hypothetical protein